MILPKLRKHLTYANVTATVALIFSMSAGAYAAKHYLITSTRQISPKVLAALKGKAGRDGSPGAQGVQGPQGSAGVPGRGERGETGASGTPGTAGQSVTSKPFAGTKSLGAQTCSEGGIEFSSASGLALACNGEAGTNGTNGANGVNGESVTGRTLARGNGTGHCEEGGAEFESEPAKGKVKTYACNGSPWTLGGTLPSGDTETGTFTADGTPNTTGPLGKPNGSIDAAIPFTIPLKTGKAAAQWSIILLGEGEKEEHEKLPAGCNGNVEEPHADAGHLCIFIGENAENASGYFAAVPESAEAEAGGGEAGKTGSIVVGLAKEAGKGMLISGTWAVTAE